MVRRKNITVLLAVLLVIMLLVIGCGGEETKGIDAKRDVPETETVGGKKSDGRSQEELNEELKKDAIEANFVELNCGEVEIGTKVYVKGKVMPLYSTKRLEDFCISTKESDDGYGVYTIFNVNTAEPVYFKENDILKIWGIYDGKDDVLGSPLIIGIIIEKE